MSREIKFRVWCVKTKHFTDSPFVSCSGGQLLWLHTGNQISISNVDNDKEYIVERFTGLKDKNYKEIYEGDILEVEDSYKCKVIYDEVAAAFQCCNLLDRNNYDNDMYGEKAYLNWHIIYCVVVGNIHENAELLKTKKSRVLL
jgi:uncharacterized phage protein (TIGR01671 family)